MGSSSNRTAAAAAGAVVLVLALALLGAAPLLVSLAWCAAATLVVAARWRRGAPIAPPLEPPLGTAPDPLQAVREQSLAAGAGAFLGSSGGRWVSADREHAALVIGPPRSGKSSAVVVPSLIASPGAVVSTSTKLDVMRATLPARLATGEVWEFGPAGELHDEGVRRLCWSPIAAATSWDHALLTARSMTLAAPALGKGTQHEAHWSERAAALLAPLLNAANRHGEPISSGAALGAAPGPRHSGADARRRGRGRRLRRALRDRTDRPA